MAYASPSVNPLFILSSPSFYTNNSNNNNNTKQVLFYTNGKSKSSLLLGSSSGISFTRRRMATPIPSSAGFKTEAAAVTIEKAGIKIVRNPPESQLSQLGVRNWPKWGCPPSKFPWTYSAKETCYLLEGKVKVYPDGSDEAVEIGAGDLVVFPKGMSCTWEVSVGVDKHYNFE